MLEGYQVNGRKFVTFLVLGFVGLFAYTFFLWSYAEMEGTGITIRFYYIGLTLPDMFEYQEGIANLIDTLYDLRDEMEAIFDKVPLIIESVTKNNVLFALSFIN